MPSFQVEGLYVEHAPAQAPPAATGRPGTRPALLLVHGAGHGAWCWEHWLGALAKRGWTSYALSLRNHPGSRAVPEAQYLRGTRVDDYADDVEAVARHLAGRAGAPRLVVVGHSLGGIVVQRFVARLGEAAERTPRGASNPAGRSPRGEPDTGTADVSVAGMILVASVPPAPFGPLRDTPLPEERGYTLDADTVRQRYFHSAPRSVTDAVFGKLVPESPSVMNEYSLGPGLAISAAHVRCPVLVLTAEHDGSAVPRDRRIADFYGGEFLLCQGIGHDLMLDTGWEGPLDAVAAWLERHWPG